MAPKNPYFYEPTAAPNTPPSWMYTLQPVDQQASIGKAISNDYNATLRDKMEDEFQRMQEYLQGAQGLDIDQQKQRALDFGLIDEATKIDQSQRYAQAEDRQARADQDKAARDAKREENEARRRLKQDAEQKLKIVSTYGPDAAANALQQNAGDPFTALDTLIAAKTPPVQKAGKKSDIDSLQQILDGVPSPTPAPNKSPNPMTTPPTSIPPGMKLQRHPVTGEYRIVPQ